jgi:hypothetical protein
MKQTVLKKRVYSHVIKDRSADFSPRMASAPTHQSEEELLEKSPWLAEIQSALSPYWSARLTR